MSREMRNDYQSEFESLQHSWKANEEESSLSKLESRVRKGVTSRRSTSKPARFFVVAFLWTTGLLLMATYRQYLHGNLGFLALAMGLLVLSAWLGTSSSGSAPLTAKPQEYIRLRAASKTRELRRTRIAQLIVVLGFAILLGATWFSRKAYLHIASWQDQLLPAGVLLIALATSAILIIVRGSRRKELAYLRELNNQFESLDHQSLPSHSPDLHDPNQE
jgi:Na+/H+ antiporter NhaD/arsenite permease-like protein